MQKFADFIGNRQICEAVAAAVRSGRVANAYLFAGPASTGKRTLALIAAAAMLCERFDGEPCGECGSCHRLEASVQGNGFHPDFGLIEPEEGSKFIRVDQVRRDLIARSQMRPHAGTRQVFLIDHADALHPSAANAFLKTLEEAPGSSAFFLISANPSALLPTVRSRCQRFNFQRMGRDELAAELLRRGLCDEEQAPTIAALSRGAAGVALRFDLERYTRERELAARFVRLALGEGEIEDVFPLAEMLHREPERFTERLESIATLTRDLMLIASAGSAAAIVNEDIKSDLLELARGRSPRKLAGLISLISDMQDPLIRNVRIDSVCEQIIVEGRELFSTAGGA